MSIALPGPWACPAFALGTPKYGLGASALSPDPIPGEGIGAELAYPGLEYAGCALSPRPTEGGVDSCGRPSPLISLPIRGVV